MVMAASTVRGAVAGFNSLFEMPACQAPTRAAPPASRFNSLFEMPQGPSTKTDATADRFNSLFEMLSGSSGLRRPSIETGFQFSI